MKKNISILVALTFSIMLSGCNSEMPELTPEQTVLISEYATHLLVKHSELSDRDLLSRTELEQGMVKEAEERERKIKAEEIAQTYLNADAQMIEGNDTGEGQEEHYSEVIPSQTIAEFLGEDSFSIDYSSYELCESYPAVDTDEFYMAMDATAGKRLCVVSFFVQNVTSEDRTFDLNDKKNKYMLRMADDENIYAQTTMLLNDLSSYRGTIPGNTAEQMVLVFEVDEAVTQLGMAEVVIKNEFGENVVPVY